MKLRRDKWQIVHIGDVVSELRNTANNPIEEGYEKYIGFEHIQPENIYLNEFGDLNDGVTFKKSFERNDVLFGKIRAYLKKVAIAPIDGICSGDILVLRTKNEDELSQTLLPYFLTTESFLKRAVDSSIGTTLPRTKWQHLAKHKISLPPLEEQKQIAALFQSIETAMEQVDGQEKKLHLLLQNLINDLVSESSKIRKGKLKNIVFGDIASNISERAEPQNSIGQIFVGLDHIDSREIKIERFGKPDSLIGTKLKVYEGDIIFGKRNAYLRKAAISTFNGICSAHAMVLRANEKKIHIDYLPFFMHSDSFMMRAKEISEGSISPTIKWKNLERQEFFIPEIEDQKTFTKLFHEIENIRQQLKQQKATLKLLKQKLLNEILG